MFGYIKPLKPELKIKDYATYRSFYCGLCRALDKRGGLKSRITLTYDCTFLIILLTSLYEPETKFANRRCIANPVKRHKEAYNIYTDYAADINLILSYLHFEDDVMDDKSIKAHAGVALYKHQFKRLSRIHEDKAEVIRKCLGELNKIEKEPVTEDTPDKAAACFGELLAEVFVQGDDPYKDDLRKTGYHLGRFIYLMDAYDDLSDDIKKNRYNPFKMIYNESDFDAKAEKLLKDEMAAAAYHFEKLPCTLYGDILRNIIYAGVWSRFDSIKEKRQNEGSV